VQTEPTEIAGDAGDDLCYYPEVPCIFVEFSYFHVELSFFPNTANLKISNPTFSVKRLKDIQGQF
jgi:hypothetical protein